MRYKLYFLVLVLLIAATALTAAAGITWKWTAGLSAAALVMAVLFIYSVLTPLRAVENGMYLLREQDFSSRLRPTGQADADKVVELYNRLIDSMKAERLKNLEQNRFLQLVVDASPLGIAICDFGGDIVQTNSAWDGMQSPQLFKAIAEISDGDTATVRLADALIVRISKLWFMDAGFRRRFIIVERLTEEIAAAEKQMFNKIVRTIGHEVNNSLGSVISVLETLQEIHADDALEFSTIESSRNSCINLVSFVRGYADIVKLPPVSPETVNVGTWISGLLPSLRGMAPQNVSINYHAEAEPGSVGIDPMLMERVIVNIVKNSIESIGDRRNGEISISIASSDGEQEPSCLIITDNGKGISETAAAKLFTPFFSTKRPDRGLGLMLIADILRAHRFPFSLATSPDTGLTSFTIRLQSSALQ